MFKNSHLLFTMLVFAGAAQAQNLTLTAAESGNFLVDNCSAVSPKYVNYPLLRVDPSTGLKTLISSVPSRCVSLVQLFVKNKDLTTPSGPVTLTDTIETQEPKGGTILNGGVGGGLTFSQNGYTCNIAPYMNSVTCTHAPLAPGEEADLSLNVLMEDFWGPMGGGTSVGLNNTAVVSGGLDTDPTDNARFDSIAYRAPLEDGLPLNPRVPRVLFTVHTVPEGQTVNVDGSVVTTPHTFAYESDFDLVHTFSGGSPVFGLGGAYQTLTLK